MANKLKGKKVLYIENPKESTKKKTKISIQNQLYFYTLAMDIPKMKLIKQFHFYNSIHKIKH